MTDSEHPLEFRILGPLEVRRDGRRGRIWPARASGRSSPYSSSTRTRSSRATGSSTSSGATGPRIRLRQHCTESSRTSGGHWSQTGSRGIPAPCSSPVRPGYVLRRLARGARRGAVRGASRRRPRCARIRRGESRSGGSPRGTRALARADALSGSDEAPSVHAEAIRLDELRFEALEDADRRRPRLGPRRRARTGARGARRARAPTRAPARPAHAGALPLRTPGGGARALPRDTQYVPRSARHRAHAAVARARAGDPPSGSRARRRPAAPASARRRAQSPRTRAPRGRRGRARRDRCGRHRGHRAHAWRSSLAGVARIGGRHRPDAGRVVDTTEVGAGPAAIVDGHGSIWVANSEDNTVSRIDPETHEAIKVIGVDSPVDLAVGRGAIWVAGGIDGTVSRIDPETNDVVAEIPLGARDAVRPVTVQGIAAGEGAVWGSPPGGGSCASILRRASRWLRSGCRKPRSPWPTATGGLGHGRHLACCASSRRRSPSPREVSIPGDVRRWAWPTTVSSSSCRRASPSQVIWLVDPARHVLRTVAGAVCARRRGYPGSGFWARGPDAEGTATRVDPESGRGRRSG